MIKTVITKILFSNLTLILVFLTLGQQKTYSQINSSINLDLEQSSEVFIEEVRTAQNSSYNEVIEIYDSSLYKNESVYIQIEKCRFIDKVFYNEEEYFNPKYEDFSACLDDLIYRFSKEIDARIYYHSNQYSDSSIVILEEIVSDVEFEEASSEIKLAWLAYQDLAQHYSMEENPLSSIEFAKKAMQENDTLDLSGLIANQFIEIGEEDQALEILISNLDSTSTYDLYKKGDLFLRLEDYKNASRVFEWLDNSGEGWSVSEELGEAYLNMGLHEKARPYLLDAITNNWNRRKALEKLFQFDLEFSSSDTVRNSYSEMREEGFMADPFGLFKFKMITKRGVLDFKLRDLLVALSYICLFIIAIILPYLWILPIYSYGNWKDSYSFENDPLSTRWGLKHFWMVSSLIILASFVAWIFSDYSDFVASFNDEYIEENITDNLSLANMILIYDLIIIIGMMLILRIKDLKSIISKDRDWKKDIVLSLGYLFFARIVYGIVNFIFIGIAELPAFSSSYLDSAIIGMVEHYGSFIAFLSVVIIAPVIEEIQFRGIMLGSMSKYVPFWFANILQSVLFVLIHDDMSLFLFYFIFGIMTGYLRKKTDSYLAPIVFHMLNNLIAFIWML